MGRTAIEIYERLRHAFARGEEMVVATVVGAGGSEPEAGAVMPGAKLLLDRDGRLVCHWSRAGAAGFAGLATEAARLLAAETKQAVAEGGPRRARITVAAGGTELEVFLDPLVRQPEVLVLGGGHIGQAVSRLATLVGFDVTVVDDRPSFADPKRFPGARRTLCGDYVGVLRGLEITPFTCVVIVTRGHRYDLACLQYVLDRPAAYVGMIGSRRRIAGVMEHLRGKGVPADLLARLHAPIGLDIGARTPEEIGLSIVAELVKQKRGGTGASLKDVPPRR